MMQDICGSQEKTLVLKQPGKPILKYTIQVGDECIVAPLSMFTPELFGITGPKLIKTQKTSTGDPEDAHDENYLRDIRVSSVFFHVISVICRILQRKGMKDNMEQNSADLLNESYLESSQIPVNEDDVVVDAIDTIQTSCDKEFVIAPGQILGLDQAVLQSIDRCRMKLIFLILYLQ